METSASKTNPAKTVTKIPQLRICLTVPCGKKCYYCRPGGEGFEAPRADEMTREQIRELAAIFVAEGVTDIKLTGGEPMLRPDIVDIVGDVRSLPGVRSLHLVTRHHRAGVLAPQLKDAGLDVLNFSIDSLDPHTWSAITGVSGHWRLIDAVYQAADSGISVKLNTVILSGVNHHEIDNLIGFAEKFGAELKLLDLIDDIPGFPPVTVPAGYARERAYNLDTVLAGLQARALASDVDTQPGGLGHPMPRLRFSNGATVLIKSANAGAWYGRICRGCAFFPCHDALMAVRLTADGKLQYCLLREDILVNLRSMLDRGDAPGVHEAVRTALDVYATATFLSREELAQARATRPTIPLAVTPVSPAHPAAGMARPAAAPGSVRDA